MKMQEFNYTWPLEWFNTGHKHFFNPVNCDKFQRLINKLGNAAILKHESDCKRWQREKWNIRRKEAIFVFHLWQSTQWAPLVHQCPYKFQCWNSHWRLPASPKALKLEIELATPKNTEQLACSWTEAEVHLVSKLWQLMVSMCQSNPQCTLISNH